MNDFLHTKIQDKNKKTTFKLLYPYHYLGDEKYRNVITGHTNSLKLRGLGYNADLICSNCGKPYGDHCSDECLYGKKN